MKQKNIKYTFFFFLVGILFNGCRTFEKIEITDHYYVQIPNKCLEHFSISVPPEYEGLIYSFENNTDSAEIIMGNHYYHFLTSFCPPDVVSLMHEFDKLQQDTASQEICFSWTGIDDGTNDIDSNKTHTYWKGLLFFKPHFAPHLDWYYIGFRYVSPDELKLYKKIFRLKHHSRPFKKRSPWAPLFNPDNIDRIYKELYNGNSD